MDPMPPEPDDLFVEGVPGLYAPGGRPLGAPWVRIIARLIDLLITSVALVGLLLAVGLGLGDAGGNEVSDGPHLAFLVASLVFGAVYEGVLTKEYGGTPGKLLLRLRVVSFDGGTPVSWSQAMLRWAVPGLLVLIPAIGQILVLGVQLVSLWLLFSDGFHRTVSDRVAKTVVISSRR